MGVEFRLYVISQTPDFRPTAVALTGLLTELVEGGWLPRAKTPKKKKGAVPVEGHRSIVGSTKKTGPVLTTAWFERVLEPSRGVLKSNLQNAWSLTWSDLRLDRVAHPLYAAVPAELQLPPEDVYFSLSLECPRSLSGVPDDGEVPRPKLRSGGRYRFALIVDCGKCFWPREDDQPLVLRPELEALVTRALGPIEQAGEVY